VAPSPKLRAFLLLRYTLILATTYLLLAEQRFAALSPLAGLLIALALASNVVVAKLPRRLTSTTRFAIVAIVYDTAWVTAALMSSGRFSADFFMLYFFLLLLAAIGENLRLIAIAASVVCAAYLFGHIVTGDATVVWSSPSLIRIPFLFTTAIFYGYLVDRTRHERQRADSAEATAAQLARTLGEFKLLYAKAQEAERVKTEFLASVSHELRTPLTSLSGYVELLMDNSYGPVSAEQRNVLGRVRAASSILHRAIQRMLHASRLEFGRDRARCDEFELREVFDQLADELVPRAGVAVQWVCADDLPALRTDHDKVCTVVRSLVENACKYTAGGFIRIESRWDRTADDVELRVSDTGIGIASSELSTIFEAFRQGGNGELGGGVGLGLYIVQRLVSRLGGEVTVESQLGMGSTFIVRLPRLLHRGDAVAAGSWVSTTTPLGGNGPFHHRGRGGHRGPQRRHGTSRAASCTQPNPRRS